HSMGRSTQHSPQGSHCAPKHPAHPSTAPRISPVPHTSLHGAQLLQHPLLPRHPSMEHIPQATPTPHTFQGARLPDYPPPASHIPPWSTAPAACAAPSPSLHGAHPPGIPCSPHIPGSTAPRASPAPHTAVPRASPALHASPGGSQTPRHPLQPLSSPRRLLWGTPGTPPAPGLGGAVRVPVPGARPALTAL
ncbi:hypothetical protein HGM15179_003752, partial [Zosterops borbonicus]